MARPPRIASRGVLAQAVSDAMAAEIVYEDSDEQSDRPVEWAGIVATRAEDATIAANSSEQQDGRRQALESYRSKLSMLQAQLRQLSTPAVNESGSELSEDAND